jgi:hypothetical protein
MSQFLHEYLGPLLGFLFTTGTIVFIAVNAPKTAREAQPEVAPAGTEQ